MTTDNCVISPSDSLTFLLPISNLEKGIKGNSQACAMDYNSIGTPREMRRLASNWSMFSGFSIEVSTADKVCECEQSKLNIPTQTKEAVDSAKKKLLSKATEDIYLKAYKSKLFDTINRSFALGSYSELMESPRPWMAATATKCSVTSFMNNLKALKTSSSCNSEVYDRRMKAIFGDNDTDAIIGKIQKSFSGMFGEKSCIDYKDYLKVQALEARAPSSIVTNAQLDKGREHRLFSDEHTVQLKTNMQSISADLNVHMREMFSTDQEWGEFLSMSPDDKRQILNMSRSSDGQWLEDITEQSKIVHSITESPIMLTIFNDEGLLMDMDKNFIAPFCNKNNCQDKSLAERINQFLEQADDNTIQKALFTEDNVKEFGKKLNNDCEFLSISKRGQSAERESRGRGREQESVANPLEQLFCQEDLPKPSSEAMKGRVLSEMMNKEPLASQVFDIVVEDAKERFCQKGDQGWEFLESEENDLEKNLNLSVPYKSFAERKFDEFLETNKLKEKDDGLLAGLEIITPPPSWEEANEEHCELLAQADIGGVSKESGTITLRSKENPELTETLDCNSGDYNDKRLCRVIAFSALSPQVPGTNNGNADPDGTVAGQNENPRFNPEDYILFATEEDIAKQEEYLAAVTSGEIPDNTPPPFSYRRDEVIRREPDTRNDGQTLVSVNLPPPPPPTREEQSEPRVSENNSGSSTTSRSSSSSSSSSNSNTNQATNKPVQQVANRDNRNNEYDDKPNGTNNTNNSSDAAARRAETRRRIAEAKAAVGEMEEALARAKSARDQRRTLSEDETQWLKDKERELKDEIERLKPSNSNTASSGQNYANYNNSNQARTLNAPTRQANQPPQEGQGNRVAGPAGSGADSTFTGSKKDNEGPESNSGSTTANVSSGNGGGEASDGSSGGSGSGVSGGGGGGKSGNGRAPASIDEEEDEESNELIAYTIEKAIPYSIFESAFEGNAAQMAKALGLVGHKFKLIEELENGDFHIREYDTYEEVGPEYLEDAAYSSYRSNLIKFIKKLYIAGDGKTLNEYASKVIMIDEYVLSPEDPGLDKIVVMSREEIIKRVEEFVE